MMKFSTSPTAGERLEWSARLNVATAKRVRELTGFDLYKTVEGQPLVDLASDPILLVDVLFAIVKPQADERRVSDLQFAEQFEPGDIETATEALIGGLELFFAHPGQRKLVKKIASNHKAMHEAAMRASNEEAEAMDPEAMVAEAIRQHREKLSEEMSSSSPSTALQDAAGSTPTHSPPASS